jgi:hypothetical protein
MSHHVFCYANILVALAVVHLENQANEVGKNRCSSRLRLDRRHTLTRLWPDYRQTEGRLSVESFLDERRENRVKHTERCEGLRNIISKQFLHKCDRTPYLSRLSARTMRLRVSLHCNLSINYSTHLSFVVRRNDGTDPGLRGQISFGNTSKFHVTACSRVLATPGSLFGRPNQHSTTATSLATERRERLSAQAELHRTAYKDSGDFLPCCVHDTTSADSTDQRSAHHDAVRNM